MFLPQEDDHTLIILRGAALACLSGPAGADATPNTGRIPSAPLYAAAWSALLYVKELLRGVNHSLMV